MVGDLNACIGGHTETCYTDTIPPRIPLEKVKNNHGKAFIEFLIDSKCCVVNGRKGNDDIHVHQEEICHRLCLCTP